MFRVIEIRLEIEKKIVHVFNVFNEEGFVRKMPLKSNDWFVLIGVLDCFT